MVMEIPHLELLQLAVALLYQAAAGLSLICIRFQIAMIVILIYIPELQNYAMDSTIIAMARRRKFLASLPLILLHILHS